MEFETKFALSLVALFGTLLAIGWYLKGKHNK